MLHGGDRLHQWLNSGTGASGRSTHVGVECARDLSPSLPEVLLPVLWKQDGEGRLLGERARHIVARSERLNLPLQQEQRRYSHGQLGCSKIRGARDYRSAI